MKIAAKGIQIHVTERAMVNAYQVDGIDTLKSELPPRLPQAVLHILPGTGHLSPLEIALLIHECEEYTRCMPPRPGDSISRPGRGLRAHG